MTILVTGGAGFIGANFVRDWLGGGGEPVINLDCLTYAGNVESLTGLDRDDGHLLVEGDIADRALVTALLAEHRPRAIVNFAAESHVDRSIDSPAVFIQTNVVGAFQLLEAARSYWTGLASDDAAAFRFLHVSTDEVYGSLGMDDPPFTEATPYAPNSPYSASKAASDHLARAYHHTYGLPVLTTNCSNNYGPRQHPEKFIPVIIESALAGRPIPIYGDGLNIRDWLYVTDHCKALRLALERGNAGETYNVGGDSEIGNIELARKICDLLDEICPTSPHHPHQRLIASVPDRPGHDFRYAIDASKIRSRLGWRPAESLETGLRKTLDWYLGNRDWTQAVLRKRSRVSRANA